MTAAGRPRRAATAATAGVGSTPRSTTSTPSAASPADSADCSSGLDQRVSRPTTSAGRPGSPLVSTRAAARPRAITSSGVSSEPATPRTPSVPKRNDTVVLLPLGVLRRLASFLQTVLLGLFLAGVPGEEAGPLERDAHVGI